MSIQLDLNGTWGIKINFQVWNGENFYQLQTKLSEMKLS